MINTFIHSRSSLENHTKFQTKMASLYPFSDQNGENTIPFGAVHTYMAYIREYSPRRGGGGLGIGLSSVSSRGCLDAPAVLLSLG